MYHLNSDAEDSLEVELATALLEEIFKGLAEEVHDHDVIGLIVFGLFIAHEMEIGNTGYRYISCLYR